MTSDKFLPLLKPQEAEHSRDHRTDQEIDPVIKGCLAQEKSLNLFHVCERVVEKVPGASFQRLGCKPEEEDDRYYHHGCAVSASCQDSSHKTVAAQENDREHQMKQH